jgi:hypothetical protein
MNVTRTALPILFASVTSLAVSVAPSASAQEIDPPAAPSDTPHTPPDAPAPAADPPLDDAADEGYDAVFPTDPEQTPTNPSMHATPRVVAPPTKRAPRPLPIVSDSSEATAPRWKRTLRDVGATVQLGAGGGGFVGEGLRDVAPVGPTWDVRAAIGANKVIGFEAAYIGSMQATNGEGLAPDATLVSTGAEGDVRLTAPIRNIEGNIDVRPFAFGGLGWQRYTFFGEGGAVDGDIQNADNIMTVPAGLGLELGVGNVTFGGRVAYRHALFGGLTGDSEDRFFESDALHQWNAGANVGVEF